LRLGPPFNSLCAHAVKILAPPLLASRVLHPQSRNPSRRSLRVLLCLPQSRNEEPSRHLCSSPERSPLPMDVRPSQLVCDAVEAARAAAVAASEARCAAVIAEKEAKAAVEFAAIAVNKVEAVKVSSNLVRNMKLRQFLAEKEARCVCHCRVIIAMLLRQLLAFDYHMVVA
jgi:hypothetical protein